LVSFVSIVATAALLALFFREVTVRETVRMAGTSSLAVARAALASVRPQLDHYLAAARTGEHESAAQELSARLAEVLRETARGSLAVKANVYDTRGMVIFSTDRARIGQQEAHSAERASTAKGAIATRVNYRDVFNRFGADIEDANLMKTYLPVGSASGDVQAVFELRTDVSPLVSQNERTVSLILAVVALLSWLLYSVLLVVVRRARMLIESQQSTIRQRTAALEMLSAQMLRGEEMQKKRLAVGLHEGLAQTLIGIKVGLEDTLQQIAARGTNGEALASIIPVLQDVIKDVQAIATELRPSSLDALGLLPTVEWFCRQFGELNPSIRVERDISLEEKDTPEPLKIVIYRIIESLFRNIARYQNTDQIRISLHLADGAIALEIDGTPRDSHARRATRAYAAVTQRDVDADLQAYFAEAQERTILSGGNFTAARNREGGLMLRASWAI
jgi:signal transduction histidine kinase